MTSLQLVNIDQCVALKRNPQYVSPHDMEALKASIQRDGFLAPVLLRPIDETSYEIVSGNHRLMAARELGMAQIPALIADMDDKAAQRVSVNLNTIHGEPSAELLAPFLADLDDEVLAQVHMSDDLLKAVSSLDETLASTLASLEIPEQWDNRSSGNIPNCVCSTCGRRHIAQKSSESDNDNV